jgi:hypothetical protein
MGREFATIILASESVDTLIIFRTQTVPMPTKRLSSLELLVTLTLLAHSAKHRSIVPFFTDAAICL